jgi:hypothetical protein
MYQMVGDGENKEVCMCTDLCMSACIHVLHVYKEYRAPSSQFCVNFKSVF